MTTPTLTPRRHLPRALLIDYVAGRAPEAVSLAVACHATLCGRCQGEIDHLEAAAGAALETGHGLAVREGLRDDVLARLDDAEPPAPPATAPASAEAAATLMLPRPLLRYLDRAGGLRWKLRLPGVHVVDLSEAAHSAAGAVARLVRFRPGLTIPLHGHGGPEYTIVFTGAFDDAGLTYARGDVCVRDASERHVQRILPGEDCVVLAVNEGPLIPLTWLGKLMRFVGERRVRSLEK